MQRGGREPRAPRGKEAREFPQGEEREQIYVCIHNSSLFFQDLRAVRHDVQRVTQDSSQYSIHTINLNSPVFSCKTLIRMTAAFDAFQGHEAA